MKNENENENLIINKKLIETGFSKKLKLHITLSDGSWRNGYVEKISYDVFYFKDDKNYSEPFFFLQVKNVEPFSVGGKK